MKPLRDIFPKASKSFIEANEGRMAWPLNKNDAQTPPNSKKRGSMNRTEAEFAMMLEGQKRAGEILRYEFEGITLRFAGVRYTPDFVVFEKFEVTRFYSISRTKFIEVKGPFIKGNRERAVERFRHAKTYWPEFTFELHQKQKDGSWKQLI